MQALVAFKLAHALITLRMLQVVTNMTLLTVQAVFVIYLGTSFISDATDEEFGNAMASMYKYSTRFDGLKDNTDYTVSISTELDGKTITQVTMTAVSKSGSSSPGASESQPQVSPGPNNKKDS